MPELPEVEVVCRGIRARVEGQIICAVGASGKRLRTFPGHVERLLPLQGQRILAVYRRGKNIVFSLERHWCVIHLGMSGQLLWHLQTPTFPRHSHVWLDFPQGRLVYNDPRRFGDFKVSERTTDAATPPSELLGSAASGMEPLTEEFNGGYLFRKSRGVGLQVKPWLMRGDVVVGVGNIYASEALFRAGIHPCRVAGRVGAARYDRLAEAVRQVLTLAIEGGGSSLRDFRAVDGQRGHFVVSHQVYGRLGQPCLQCGREIQKRIQTQRASFFCSYCQR